MKSAEENKHTFQRKKNFSTRPNTRENSVDIQQTVSTYPTCRQKLECIPQAEESQHIFRHDFFIGFIFEIVLLLRLSSFFRSSSFLRWSDFDILLIY